MKRNMMVMTCGLLMFTGCVDGPFGQTASLTAPGALTVEYRANPIGMDTAVPRLSWKLFATDKKARGLRQTAYRVLVASSLEILNDDKGDLWDSGRVVSDQSLNVVYKGVPLKSSQHCYWKVRAWDNKGE